MSPVRHVRNLAPLAAVAILVAAVLSACGSGSSSSSSPSVAASDQLEVRPVYARYAPGVALGPEIPKDLVDEMSGTQCPTDPRVVGGKLLMCDPGKTVFLMDAPIISGGVQKATATHIGNQKLWYVRVDLTEDAQKKLTEASKSLDGHEIAYVFGGEVITSIIVDSSYDPTHVVLLGDYDEAQAKKLAEQINAA
jgi:SecDF, P1 head subdomain